MIRISRNNDLMIIHDLIFDVNIVIGIGNSSAISTWKIMNITAVKKNRDEKGRRAEYFWAKLTFELRSFSSVFIDFLWN
jgi:hypothetical protein